MPLLNVDQATERLAAPRFIRRLAERRIAYAKLGRRVRIDSADLDAFVAAGRVEPGVDAGLATVGPTVPQTPRFRSAGGRLQYRTTIGDTPSFLRVVTHCRWRAARA